MFATWVRLEPRSRTADLSGGVAAPIADPLWFLTRQIQTGELKADNAGSPIRVELSYETQAVDSVNLGAGHRALGEVPLEALVERETFEMDWRMRVRVGQQFERQAKTVIPARAVELIALYRQHLGLAVPPPEQLLAIDQATQRFIRLMAMHVIDGKRLLDDQTAGTLPPLPGDWSAAERDQVDNLFDGLAEWRLQLYSEPGDTEEGGPWKASRLAYRFGLNPPRVGNPDNPTELLAPDYRSGELDWYSLSAASPSQGNWQPVPQPIDTVPTRITVGGPSLRWWAFEDAHTDFGDLDSATPDLAKLLLMEFALIYGDDWFSVPVPVGLSHLVRITDLRVFNVFGEETPVASARRTAGGALQRWEIFTLSRTDDPRGPGFEDCLFIPPVSHYREESPPLEEVRFMRDEGANMVWGVEYLLPNGMGKPVRGIEAQRERIERQRAYDLETIPAEIAQKETDLAALRTQLEDSALGAAERADLETEMVALEEQRARQAEALARLKAPRNAAAPDGVLTYRLATTVPENWIPFMPAQLDPLALQKTARLTRAQMLRNTADDEPTPIPALSRLLGSWDDPLLWLDEYAVSRAGVRVLLTRQRVRDSQGRTFVWLGKKVLTGRGEGSSGLKFDVVK